MLTMTQAGQLGEIATSIIAMLITACILIVTWAFTKQYFELQKAKQKPDLIKTIENTVYDKIQDGTIETQVAQQVDHMIQSVTREVLNSYDGVGQTLKTRLQETMIPHIEKYDFSKHSTKLELLLNELIDNIISNDSKLLKSVKDLFVGEPIETITTSEVFDKYVTFVKDNIDESELDIIIEDGPSYDYITAQMSVVDGIATKAFGTKCVKLSCADDNSLDVTISLTRRITHKDVEEWYISHVYRTHESGTDPIVIDNDTNILSLDTPLNSIRNLSDFEIFLARLKFDRTVIVIDETDITDDDITIDSDPTVGYH